MKKISAKRLFDLCVASTLFIFFLPIFVVIAILIKMNSKGPIFYIGNRTGFNGVPFGMYKFRSMVLDADKGAGTTGFNDPRVTSIGKILRYYKLDELPQLLNVIKGDMSIVGPRPELSKYTDLFTEEEKIILTVRPGITDYSSVVFSELDKHAGEIEPEKNFENKILPIKNKLRIQYVKESNFWVDIIIIIKTVMILLPRIFPKFEKRLKWNI